ncbi:MAG: hypothetical protein JNL92_16005 [Opitutaceae bacterium]|nr:hypothetical protein [Opitutaceae bacterium]
MNSSTVFRLAAPGLVLLAFLLGAGPVSAAGAAPRVFKAGAATSNITPALGAGIVGGWSAPAATHIHDELHVRCLALDDGTTRLVFAVVDSVGVSREVFDEAKRLVHEATGLPTAQMMMSATHTHSAVSSGSTRTADTANPLGDYRGFLIRRIADGVRRAINNLEPARIGWGAGQVPQHLFNRRWLLQDGKKAVNPFGGEDLAVMNPGGRTDLLKPAGPTNPEVYFISIQSTSGRPIALLANYWLHYVGGVGPNDISADYFAVFCDRIQELLGADRQDPPFVGLLANGPCGDVNNNNYTPGAAPGPRYGRYEKMRVVANDVAQEVMRVHRTLRHHDWVELRAAQAELELRMRRPTPAMVARAQEILARPATVSPLHRRELDYARRTVAAQEWPESVKIVLQAFRLGGLGVAAIPFEVFTETGLAIKAKSPFADTFTIELANGSYGYLPTPEQHALGGYETWLGTNRVELEASRKIEARVLELLAALK